jgi:uncharacterized protein YecE (DUF72 family)
MSEVMSDMKGTIWIGTSGFAYKEWKPSFYPEDLPQRRFLEYYATVLNAVEIDSSFYRMPSAKTLDAWREATPEGFRFALKASRRITHWERLRLPSEALDYLLSVVERLEDRLGTLLFQLPPNLKSDRARLELFLSQLPETGRFAFEFRHESWFTDDVYALLRSRDVALCVHDADDHTTPLEVTAPQVFVRLRRSGYSGAQLERWREQILEWSQAGIDVYAFVKHQDNPDAPLIARELARSLRA